MNGCTGLRAISAIRMRRHKPPFVHVTLRQELIRDDAEYPLDSDGSAHVQVADGAELSGLDWRPLVGLDVHLYGFGGDENRLRKVARAIAAVQPRTLRVFVPKAGSFVMQRFEGGRWLPGVPLCQ